MLECMLPTVGNIHPPLTHIDSTTSTCYSTYVVNWTLLMDSSPDPFAPLGDDGDGGADDGDPKTPCCPANDAAETGEVAPAAPAYVPAMDLNVSTSNVRVVGSSLDS